MGGMESRQPLRPRGRPLQFGAVAERVVHALGQGKTDQGLDLVQNKLVDLPEEFGRWPAPRQNQWRLKNGVDLVVDLVTDMGPDAKSRTLVPEGLKVCACLGGKMGARLRRGPAFAAYAGSSGRSRLSNGWCMASSVH